MRTRIRPEAVYIIQRQGWATVLLISFETSMMSASATVTVTATANGIAGMIDDLLPFRNLNACVIAGAGVEVGAGAGVEARKPWDFILLVLFPRPWLEFLQKRGKCVCFAYEKHVFSPSFVTFIFFWVVLFRLYYTHDCIAYLFRTSLKGAVDIPLMTLMTFMNEGFVYRDGRSSHFTFEEVRDCVAELGRRQMLIFTQEGGVQLGEV